MLAGDLNRLSIGREYGFHSSTGRELSPLGSREQKFSPLDKKFKVCQSRYWNCQQRADRRQKNPGFKQEAQIISKEFDFLSSPKGGYSKEFQKRVCWG
jgi:hypothetical protein